MGRAREEWDVEFRQGNEVAFYRIYKDANTGEGARPDKGWFVEGAYD